MTSNQKNSIANWIFKILMGSGVLGFCIIGFISYGKLIEKVDKNGEDNKTLYHKCEQLENSKASKEDVLKMWEDVKYIRQRMDHYIEESK